jgi:hypothetical protein
MVAVLVIVGIVVVLGLGFYLTRGARGPGTLDAEGRAVDAESRAGPLGEPMPFDSGGAEHQPTPDYAAEARTPSEDVWAREEARYRAKNEGEQRP